MTNRPLSSPRPYLLPRYTGPDPVSTRRSESIFVGIEAVLFLRLYQIELVGQIAHPQSNLPVVARHVERSVGQCISSFGCACVIKGIEILLRLIFSLDTARRRHGIRKAPLMIESHDA